VTRAVVQPYATAARGLLRATLLDATREQLRDRPWSEVTMAAVARAAGVSRQTLYNEFGSRAELAQASVLRETDRFLAAVEQAVVDHREDPVAALAAAFEVFLVGAAEDPVVRAIMSAEGDPELLPLVTTQGGPVLERATDGLGAVLAREWPELDAGDARLLAECVVRLAISHATLPSGPAALTGASVARLLGPFAERATG
jgi:AcrR family transcriptional regulator